MAHAQIEWANKIEQLPWIGEITQEELSKHNKPDDIWAVYKGDVYDITRYMKIHPGGTKCLMNSAGGDMTEAWNKVHKYISPDLISKCKIGFLV